MKKKLVSIILLALLGSVLFIPFSSAAQPDLPITESFDSWNDNEWVITETGSSDFALSDDQVHMGDYSGHFYQAAYGGGLANIEMTTDTWYDNSENYFIVEFWIYFNLTSADSTHRNHFFALWEEGYGIILLALNDTTNNLIVWDADSEDWTETETTISEDKWIHMAVLLGTNDPFDFLKVFVDGDLAYDYDTFGYEGDVSEVVCGCDYIQSGTGAFSFFYDDIHIYAGVYASVWADLEPDNSLSGIDWVFTEWRYYTFTVQIPTAQEIDYVYLGLTGLKLQNNTAGLAGFSAWTNGTGWEWAMNIQDPSRDLDAVYGSAGTWENDSLATVVTFPLWFTDQCVDIWEPDEAIDCLVWYNLTDGTASGWITAQGNYFFVYNKGGFSRTVDSWGTGNSGALPGGRDFQMHGYNDSYVFKDLWFRDLTHLKMVPEIQFVAGYQYFVITIGFDYVLKDGSYQNGLTLIITPDSVSYTGVFASNVWINYTTSWNSQFDEVKSEDLYAFYHGEVYNAGDIGRWKIFLDFWFDEGNGSTLIGGRINAYEFPMQDSSGAWFRWLSSNWGIKDDVKKQSECFTHIHSSESDDNITISSQNILFVRPWMSLSVTAGADNQYVAIQNFDVFETTFSPEEGVLVGISSPPWDETNMPAMRNTGVLGAVWSMFQGIGNWLSENILFGGLNLWGTFVAFLDSIAAMFGAPYFFTNLFIWIGEALGNLGTAALYAWDVVANVFILIGSMIAAFIGAISEVVLSFATFITNFVDFMAGGLGAGANLWNELGISTWITVAIIFYPLYLIILWEEKGLGAVIEQLTWMFGLLVFLYHFFEGIILGAISLITALIESIPVVE